jgi:hypothetical protein
MSLFGSILAKLGFGSAPPPAQATAPTPAPPPAATAQVVPPRPAAPPRPASIAVVDVMNQLETLAASSAQKLNWKTSIVDLLKLLELDSSLTARKELANELGCPRDLQGDSAKMNMWLHKTVLQRIADNGGNIPRHMLD